MFIKSLKPQFAVMLIFTITAGLYYGSLMEVFSTNTVLTLDDSAIMNHLTNHEMQVSEALMPRLQKDYYRPLIDLSYLLDQRLYGSMAFGFRLTNLLIHSFNVILVYLLARMLLMKSFWREGSAFFAALLFAVHPLAVEPVVWISGRSDLIATFWSLLAMLFYLLSKNSAKWYLLLPLSLIFTLFAILSKEVAIAIPIIIAAWEFVYCQSFGYRQSRYSLPVFLLLACSIAIIFLARQSVLIGGDAGTGIIINKLRGEDFPQVVELFLSSFGFYLKKFLYPFPLNFSINEINVAVYAPLGAAAIVILLSMAFVKNMRRYHFFFFWAMLGLGPAAIVSFTDIAWTRWAERYLYFSLVPLSILTVMAIRALLYRVRNPYRWASAVIVVPILILATSSYHRSFAMSSNEKIWRDSFKKSPDFIDVATAYANSLISKGDLDGADKILNQAMFISGPKHSLFLNLGHISRIKGDNEEAKAYYQRALAEAKADKKLVTVGPGFRRGILTTIANLELKKAEHADNREDEMRYREAAISALLDANDEQASSFLIYRVAKLYLLDGRHDKAASYLKKFINKGGSGYYKKAAENMLKKLEEQNPEEKL